MPNLTITPNIEEAPWSDLKHECPDLGVIERIGRLPRGMTSGKSSVTVVIRMPDGRRYMAETSRALFRGAMRAIDAREALEEQSN